METLRNLLEPWLVAPLWGNLLQEGRHGLVKAFFPGMQGYSLVRSQTARFTSVTAQTMHAFLQDGERLYCVEDRPKRTFWLYWGDPAYDTPPYGTICFGDLELQEPHTLLVSALSDKRMEVLLDLLRPLDLGTPQARFDLLPYPPKPTRKTPGRKRRRPL